MKTRSFSVAAVLLATALLMAMAVPAAADETPRPFRASLVGYPDVATHTCDEGIPFAGYGTTHGNIIGRATWTNEWCSIALSQNEFAVTEGRLSIYDYHGNELWAEFTGVATVFEDGTTTFTFQIIAAGGVGRYEMAEGSWIADGSVDVDGVSHGRGRGWLDLDG